MWPKVLGASHRKLINSNYTCGTGLYVIASLNWKNVSSIPGCYWKRVRWLVEIFFPLVEFLYFITYFLRGFKKA